MTEKKKSRTKKLQQALEKRVMLDAASIFAAVEAIPDAVLHLDAQDVDGDNDTSAGDQPADGATVTAWTDGEQANADNTPTVAMGAITYDDDAFGAGRGGLRFDGGDEYVMNGGGGAGNEADLNSDGPFPEKSFAFTFRTGTDINFLDIMTPVRNGEQTVLKL